MDQGYAPPPYAQQYAQQYGAPYSAVPPVPPVPPAAAGYTNHAAGPAYGAPYAGGYDPAAVPLYAAPADLPVKKSRFPAGAIWLIGLGAIFLVANTGLFRGVPDSALVGIGLIGLSVWIFVSKMLNSGFSLSDDGSPMYGVRVMRALRGAVWVLLIGRAAAAECVRCGVVGAEPGRTSSSWRA